VKREAEEEDRANIAADFYGPLLGTNGTPHSIATSARQVLLSSEQRLFSRASDR
jgi:hypothetical protein